MARFLAAIQGSRGEATRLGTPSSGIRASAQGWDCGVTVNGYVGRDTDRDEFQIYATGGSNGRHSPKLIATVVETPEGYEVIRPN